MSKNGGRFDFDDGGSYSGGWLDGKAHGHGVCTGPKGQGEYAGSWVRGFEDSGVYTWPSGNTYSGEWQDGKRHGVGVEIKGHWVYRGEWSQGYKGRYGIRQSTISRAKYEGTWTTSFQDGYGVETYVDEGTYQGQWQRGMRHGFGVRQSAPYGVAAQYRNKEHLHGSEPTAINSHGSTDLQRGRTGTTDAAVNDRHRGGFVLTGKSSSGGFKETEQPRSRSSSTGRSLADRFLRRGQSTGDLPRALHHQTSIRSSDGAKNGPGPALGGSGDTGHDLLPTNVDIADADVTETYMGEWKADKRSGFGVSERSDGLKYIGEWYNDKKHGYGVTTLKDGTKEEGKYKDNELMSSGRKRKVFLISKTRLRDRVDAAVVSAARAAELAHQKALIAASRKANAKLKAEDSDKAAMKALTDADSARDEAIKYSQQVSETITLNFSEVPVNMETRVRMLPGHEDRDSLQQQQQLRHLPRRMEIDEKSSRLSHPRQESSDSYTSNQSSSVGSSSVPRSPPPPKPPRSSPSTVDSEDPGHIVRRTDLYPQQGSGKPPGVLPRQEIPIVPQTNPSLYSASDPAKTGNQMWQSNRVEDSRRAGYGATTDALSSQPYGERKFADRGMRSNSFRNSSRAFAKLETSSQSSYRDLSDTAAGGIGHDNLYRTPSRRDNPSSPKIQLHPPTPLINRGSQKTENANTSYQQSQQSRRFDDVTSTYPPVSAEPRQLVSPVLSDRSYQQPISQVLSPNPDVSQERDREHPEMAGDSIDGSANPPSRGSRLPVENEPQHHHHHHHPHQQQSRLFSSSSEARIPGFLQTDTRSGRVFQDNTGSLHRNRSHVTGSSTADSGLRRGGTRSGTSSPSIQSQSLQRRGTLPSILHYPPTHQTGVSSSSSRSGTTPQVGIQDVGLVRASPKQTFIIENGVRRRLLLQPAEETGISFSRWETDATETEPKVLLQRFALEPTSSGLLDKGGIKSSLPDVYRIRETMPIIPREQVFELSQQRRDEVRRKRDEMERGTVVIRMADLTAWCKENQLIILLVALNLSLAAMFLRFLSQNSNSKS